MQEPPLITQYSRMKRLATHYLESGDVIEASRAMKEANNIKLLMLRENMERLDKFIDSTREQQRVAAVKAFNS